MIKTRRINHETLATCQFSHVWLGRKMANLYDLRMRHPIKETRPACWVNGPRCREVSRLLSEGYSNLV